MARSAAQGEPFDAVLLDLNMPAVDGFELARAILADTTLPPARLVLLTSSGAGGEARQALEAGITAYLAKPVRQSQLYDCLATAMSTPPAPTATNGHTDTRPRAARQGTSGHILLAEDNPVNQRVATAMLEHLGFQVDIAADGAEAVKATTQTAYQAILMDCQMPVQDGYQATGEIRRLEGVSVRTPIIAVTASALKSDRQRCLAAGMDDYLPKPLSLEALVAVLDRWAPAPSDSPALDPEVVARLERLGKQTDEDLLGQLATLFLAEAETTVVVLRKALADGDAAALVRLAHTLRGASANLGAAELARLCATLEMDAAAGDLSGGSVQVEAVAAELERVRSALGSPALTP